MSRAILKRKYAAGLQPPVDIMDVIGHALQEDEE